MGFYFLADYGTTHALDMGAILARFAIRIYNSAGLRVTTYPNLALDTMFFQESHVYKSAGMALIHTPQRPQETTGSAYLDDTYRADLRFDGAVVAHTTFTVGSGHAPPSSRTQAKILMFYATTETAYSTWTDSGVPLQATQFPSSQGALFFYLRWSSFSPYLPITIAVDSTQHAEVAHRRVPSGCFPLPTANGSFMYIVTTPDQSPYNPGAYTATISTGDTTLARLSLQVTG